MYADFEYYTKEYGGSLIPQQEFDRSVLTAERYINLFTFNRITEDNKDQIDGLKDCCCDMAEEVFKALYKSSETKEKKSENIDGYSVTYVTEGTDGENIRKTLEKKLYDIANLYFCHTDLMYTGVLDVN